MILMEQEFTVQETYERGLYAAKLRDDAMLQEVLGLAREKFIEESINAEDVASREAARARVLAIAEVRQIFDAIVSGGEYAGEVLRRANS